MKEELIKSYREYKKYVFENFEYHQWPELENHLPSFVEFLETGKLSISEGLPDLL